MSGHNKWSKIKKGKEVKDRQKSSDFSKLARIITLAVIEGAGIKDPENNIKLRLAIEKAKQGLDILALCQEKHKAQTGHYTRSLSDLARASGDAEQFQTAMLGLFEPELFRLEASLTGYRISGAARDRKKTRVSFSGPAR